MSLSEKMDIIETKSVPSNAMMLFGFPDVGLVGVIAAEHLITELGLTEVAYLDSRLLPPIIVLHEGLPHSPIRVFGNDKLLLAVSETAMPAEVIYPVMHALIDWGKSKKVKLMVSLSGMPAEDRQNLKELKVFAAASSQDLLRSAKDKGVEVLAEGYMVGPQAVLLQHCARLGLPALTLMAQCFFNYPDPEAGAEVLKGLAMVTGIKVDVAKLLEKGEEIRLKARDVMQRTQQEMAKMKKGQELDMPMYVT